MDRFTDVQIKQDGLDVVIVHKERAIVMPYQAALEVAKAIIFKAKKCEEIALALKIAKDEAILIRAGIPIGLTNHPDIKKEAMQMAQHDSKLRRFMPLKGVQTGEHVGTPSLKGTS